MNYKLKIVLMTLSAAAVIFGGVLALVPKKAEAALTESQIQAILDLLQSFGADQAIVGNVNSSLHGLPKTSGGGGTAAFCPNFTYNLYLGLNDSETEGQATQLQKFLAQDSIVYPEGHMTGFYGPLTKQAVKRWQAKNGLVSSGSPDTTGYGVMGVQTREKIRAFCPTPLPIPIPPQTCPQYSSPFCQANEKITPGGMDASGCQLPEKCVPAGASLPPVISGVSGPTALNTSQSGTWTVTARDPENSPLSYSVVWGDEVAYPTPLRTPSASESVKQTATFTHAYFNAGVYTPIFYVMDSQGLSAKTSISVNVGGAVVSQGSLYLSPSDPTIKVGQKMNLQAFYQPLMPPCLEILCAQVMPASYPVEAKWISSNSSVVSVSYAPLQTFVACPNGCYNRQVAVISGLAAGTASISAAYQLPSGTTLTTRTQVNIQSDSQPSIAVSVATEKSTYAPDEQIQVIITAKNNSPETAVLNFNTGCQVGYAMAFFDSTSAQLCTMALTSVSITPYGSKTWNLVHDPATYRIPAGSYKLTGKVFGYGEATAPITVKDTMTTPSITVDLKVNGSDGPITATPTQNLSVTWSASGFTSGLATCSFSNYPVGSSLGSQSSLSGSDSISFSAVTPPRTVDLTVTCFNVLRTTTASVPSISDKVVINIPAANVLCANYECAAPPLGCSYAGGIDSQGCPTCGTLVCTFPSITVLSPNGGENWTKGTAQSIKWASPPSFSPTYGDITLTSYSTPCDPKTQLCAAMPSVLYTLAKSAPLGNGSFSWKVGYDINGSDIPAGQYVVRITDSSSGASDSSDAPFNITVSSALAPSSSGLANVLEAVKPLWWPWGF